MKQYFLLISIISLFAFSCDKVKKMDDDITFRKYSPYLELNPLDSVGKIYSPSCFESIPFPTDSVESFDIDVDKDGKKDYKFTYSTYYDFVNVLDSCENHNSRIMMKAIGIGNSILMVSDHTTNVKIFEVDEKITNDYPMSIDANIFYDDGSSNESIIMENGNKYIGVKLSDGGLGWIKVYHNRDSMSFAVMEHAYNRNIHLGIKAGKLN